MKVFISWSGPRSRLLAEALREFLGDVIQALDPFVSSKDLVPGDLWIPRLVEALSETKFGIVCVTSDNFSSEWLVFEAGALSRSLERGRVCPILLDLKASSLRGPLSTFQCILAERDGIRSLLTELNKLLSAAALPEERLQRSFDDAWPRLEERLSKIPEPSEATSVARRELDMLEEIVGHVRDLRFGRAGRRSEMKSVAQEVTWPSVGAEVKEIHRFFVEKLLPEAERQAHKDYLGVSLSDEERTLRERKLSLAENAAREHGLWDEWIRWRGAGDTEDL